nr:hypothetical protein [Tanacetum cinerariifolium]
MKRLFQKLFFYHGNLHDNVKRLRVELDRVQYELDADPFNSILRGEEAAYVLAFNEAFIMQESRISRSRIDVVTTCDGALCSNDQVPVAFVNHYAAFLGQKGVTLNLNSHNLFTNTLDIDVALDMIKTVTSQESLGILWEMILRRLFNKFFNNGTLLKELNHTIIALILKVAAPSRINDYRLISCCNVLFKCISKIIANHIKDILKFLVSPNQIAFVPGRRISDNILLIQELMHNYHLDRGQPRYAFKVDIQKAYDTMDWDFLKDILMGFGFHPPLIHWIMECVSSTTFLVSINGSIHGFLRENVVSVKVIMKAWDKFKMVSGLTPSLSKSRLPVKYLGVPLISSRIIYRDCRILLDIEQLMRGFFWCQDDMHRDKANVAWDVQYDVGMEEDPSASSLYSIFIWYRIGDGSKVSMWFDRWCPISPLSSIISPHDIHRAGFDMFTVVKDTIVYGQWTWPHEWILRYPILATLGVSAIVPNELDNLEWRTSSRTTLNFFVLSVWECIRARGEEVNCNANLNLFQFPLCDSQLDSHDHLFFECVFSLQVWNHVKVFAGLPMLATSFNDIIDRIISYVKEEEC